MTQIPAGWYPDPDPEAPEPKGQRYWDGQQWTQHVQPPAVQQPAAPGYPAYPAGGYGGAQVVRATTPDGQELAGWWARLVAYLLDGIIVGVIGLIVGWPWVSRIGDAFQAFFDEALRAAEQGRTTVPGQADLVNEIAGPLLTLTLLWVVVSAAYHMSFLRWKAATPGKLALGLRVRLRETPGPLSWGTIARRWLSQYAYAVLTVVPVLGAIVSLYPIIDGLWAAWDPYKQALHDKVARTNVVRQRVSV